MMLEAFTLTPNVKWGCRVVHGVFGANEHRSRHQKPVSPMILPFFFLQSP